MANAFRNPMPYFHATFRRNLDGIRRKGLGGGGEANWPGCGRGVHLAREPAVCLLVMVEHYALFGDPHGRPADHLNEIVVIVVDDSRVRQDLLRPDPLIPRDDVVVHAGVIDVSGMPVLGVDDVMVDMGRMLGAEVTPPRP